ncbi:MAG TPA: TonB-dependent receptor [Reyranella sp.]|nr:TonB-dependent receptor [Reyranella sp.]
MRRRLAGSTFMLGAALASPALAQTPPDTTPVVPADNPLSVTVTAKRLDEQRGSIQPSLGASRYDFTAGNVGTVPQGEQAPINEVLLRAPGVAQDSFGQIHVRGDHGNLQYRLDGVQLPEGMSLFSNALATQYASKMSLITGALPAQYGFRQAGVVDITVKSGHSDPGAEASMTGGSYNWAQPSFSYGGSSGKYDWFLTGQFLHNDIGIENPAPTAYPIHDSTDQWHGLAKITAIVDDNTRLSFIAGGSNARYQIPQVSGNTPAFTVMGNSVANSAALDQRQWEDNYFGMLALQKHYGDLDFQLSGFSRYSNLAYQPDPLGDLMFNGISPWANRNSVATGVQGDGSWKLTAQHTLRAGFLVQREHATSFTAAQVLPVDGSGTPTSDQPLGVVFGADQIGWTYGVYLQDEWKVTPTVTINYGLRFDAIDANTQENQLSPRVNVVWQPNDVLTAHAGYARYFTPPPLSQVNNGAIAATSGTTAQPAVTQNDPVKAERAHYFDAGLELQPTDALKFGFDAYYKIAQNLLDEGQFGAPIFLSSFNYANAEVKGIEITGSYDNGPWSLYGNVAWSEAKGSNINSAQFNFQPAELAFIAQNYIYLDHNQSWTGSGGAAYTFNQDSRWATRVSADLIVGSGLRSTVVTPNDTALPTYAVVNASLVQKIPIDALRGTQLRFDVLNLFDHQYELRDGTGVGVGAPQFGQRRTFLLTLAQKF